MNKGGSLGSDGKPVNLLQLFGAPGAMPELTRFTDILRRQGKLVDGPDGSRLVLDPTQRKESRQPDEPVLNGQARTAWLRGDQRLTQAILADRASGLTQAEIAAKRGVHVQTVRRHLEKAGSPRRQPLTEAQIEEAQRFRAEG